MAGPWSLVAGCMVEATCNRTKGEVPTNSPEKLTLPDGKKGKAGAPAAVDAPTRLIMNEQSGLGRGALHSKVRLNENLLTLFLRSVSSGMVKTYRKNEVSNTYLYD